VKDLVAARFLTYVLAGRVGDPTRALIEARDAAKVGLGGVWLSERYATKEPAVIGGALAIAEPSLDIGGTFYAHMRHPIVTASIANTMQALTGDRFTLVLARASEDFFKGFDVPLLTFERVRDTLRIMRRLWAGDSVDYSGVLGTFSRLRLADRYDGPAPPVIFTAMGPKALAFAGEHCDGVLLHPLLTADAVQRSAAAAREAAKIAGRDCGRFRVIANVIVAPDLPPEEEAAVLGGRAITYLQAGLGDLIVDLNGWDAGVLGQIRNHPKLVHLKGAIASKTMTREDLADLSRLIPWAWLAQAAAAGSAADVAKRLCGYLQAGADEILLHGASPRAMAQLVIELRKRLEA
jgi:5,10-methylenetetrahydromethanopterin reductase